MKAGISRHARLRAVAQYVAVAAAGFLLAFLLIALVVFPDDGQVPPVKVPTVVGLPFLDAERRLRGIGLVAEEGERRFSGDAPKSTVLAQSPLAGELLRRGSAVTLDVSDGQQQATVPALAGLSRDDATAALAGAALALGEVTERSGEEARGVVLESSPTAGQVVPAGTQVAVVISGGPAELAMPDVVGRDRGSAGGMLEQLGLVVGPLDFDSASTLLPGTVVSQTPAAGTPVASGSTITLRIAGRP